MRKSHSEDIVGFSFCFDAPVLKERQAFFFALSEN